MNARVALVTGAASGIGAATVERFVAEGIRVVAFDRTTAAPRDGVTGLVGDVTLQGDVDEAIDAARRSGGPQIVVNAAGIVAADDPENVEDSTWERMLAVNLTGTMRVCRAAIPLMRVAGGGAIVNVASVAAFNSSPGSASYASAKAGVVAYTRNIAFAHGADGIRANCLCPGWTATAMAEAEMREAALKSGRSAAQETEALASRLTLRRLGRPEEIAACIRFLVSDEASFVTGAVLVADGGGRIATSARGL